MENLAQSLSTLLTPDFLDQLATSLGDIARGCKKLKSCVLKIKNATLATSVTTPPEEPHEDTQEELQEELQEEPSFTGVLEKDFVEIAEQYFEEKPFVGKASFKRYLEYCIDDHIRQDRLKTTWVFNGQHVKTSRKAWTKISQTAIQDLYSEIKNGWEQLQDCFNGNRPDHILQSKWSRRTNITEIHLDDSLWKEKRFREYINEAHLTHGPLRG
jgi:hypothetical protein